MKATFAAFLLFITSFSVCRAEVPATTPPRVDATEKATEKKTVRLLTVGNSFSRNATRYLPDFVKESGHKLEHSSIVVGGASLELHATKAKKHEADPKDADGIYKEGKSLKKYLQAKKWDIITMQQASIRSHNIETYQPYAKELYDYIKQYSPDAKIMLHETWAYRVDDPRFSPKNTKPGEPLTQQAMYDGLHSAYTTIADTLGIGIIPTGDAFYLADTDATWKYKPETDASFDAKTARHPQLPEQKHSLHIGWMWKKNKDGKQALGMDGHHANKAGEYLGACVFYETLYKDDVRRLTFVPKGLDPEYAAFLRETAYKAVHEHDSEKTKTVSSTR